MAAQAAAGGLERPCSRALVPIHPTDRCGTQSAPVPYPSATFLAHLIAVDRRMPQTRGRGRAAPLDAVALYAATSTGAPPRPGGRLRRRA